MELQELFTPADLLVGFRPDDKWAAIRDLLGHLVQVDEQLKGSEESFLEALFERERSMSTGMERGIAIPHAAVDGLDQLRLAMGIIPAGAGIDFSSIDGTPTQLVILLLIPRDKKLLHIRTLADIARGLGREGVLEALMDTADTDAAWASFGLTV